MTFDDTATWWILAGLLVVAELATGTFYLLMLAVGAAAGAVAAHLNASLEGEVVAAAVVGTLCVGAWHRYGPPRLRHARVAANRDVNLDVGERLEVPAWKPDGTARVSYRGADWNVRHAVGGPPRMGTHVITEVRHNELLVRPADTPDA